MYIERRPYRRAHAQRIADLSALIKYMLEAKDPDEDLRKRNHEQRLAGPPVTRRLVQRISPYGETIGAAAYDLAHQLFKHARDCVEFDDLPSVVYQYLLFSLPVNQPLNKTFLAFTSRNAERQSQSDFQVVVRMVNEVLDAMGIGKHVPYIIVVHNDTVHYHAHVVVGMFAADVNCSEVFPILKPGLLKEISSAMYAGNRWPQPSGALASVENVIAGPGRARFPKSHLTNIRTAPEAEVTD